MVYQGGETTDGKRIYVGNINYDCKEDEVRQQFNEVSLRCTPHSSLCRRGALIAIALPRPSQFGQITSLSYKQGFAFIDYADQRDAQDAIMSMNQKQLAGRTITVELSGRPPKDGKPPPRHGDSYDRGPPRYDDRSDQRGSFGGAGGGNSRAQASSDVATRNLFVGNIPPDATESDVMAHFGKYGDVAAVKFLPKKSDTFAAFVDFHNVEHARDAHDSSNMLGGMKLRTDYNQRKSASGPPPGGPSRGYDDEYDRGYDRAPPPPPRYDERPPPRYDDRYDDRRGGYDDRAPPPPRYDDRAPPPPRYDERPPPRYEDRYDDRRGGYDDRAPPPPRYDERAPPPPRYDERPPPRYDDRRYDDRGPPPSRERDYYGNDGGGGGGYDRGPPPPQRYDDRGYDDRGPPPPRYDDRG